MTTITYRNGVMACDSQVTYGGTRWSQARKIVKFANGALFGGCGDLVNCAAFAREVDAANGKVTLEIIKQCPDMSGLFVQPTGEVWCIAGGKRGGFAPVEGEFFADGSGFVAAMAAMMGGADAVQAIEIAAKLDVHTSLPVYTETLGKPTKRRRK